MATTPNQFDVVILGGGPAGAAAAILLARRQFKVAVLERSGSENRKVGEMLPPESRRLLQALEVWEEFQRDGHLASPGMISAWTEATPIETDFIFNPYGTGWLLDRQRFETMLLQAAARSGVDVIHEVRVLECLRTPPGNWRIEASQRNEPRSFSAAYLIDATGRASWLAHRQGVQRPARDHLVGLVGQWHSASRDDHRLLLEAFSDGWWYSVALPGGRVTAVCLTDADELPHGREAIVDFWNNSLGQAPLTEAAIGSHSEWDHLQTISANTSRLERAVGDHWLAVGDAAAAYDPLSSRGISKALESALRAAPAVSDWLKDRKDTLSDYSDWVTADFDRYLQQYQEHYAAVSRWPNSRFWQRRRGILATSIRKSFSPLVD